MFQIKMEDNNDGKSVGRVLLFVDVESFRDEVSVVVRDRVWWCGTEQKKMMAFRARNSAAGHVLGGSELKDPSHHNGPR